MTFFGEITKKSDEIRILVCIKGSLMLCWYCDIGPAVMIFAWFWLSVTRRAFHSNREQKQWRHARDTPPPWANHGPKRSEKGNACPKVSLAPLPWPGRLDSRKSGVIASRIKALHRECRTLAGRERGENDTHSCDRASTQRLKFRFLTTQCLFYDHCESFFQMLFRRIVKFENPDFKCRASLK